MSSTFKEIRRLVLDKKLDNTLGFGGSDIRKVTKAINEGTATTFIWKHADNAGQVDVLYFHKLSRGKYQIIKQRL